MATGINVDGDFYNVDPARLRQSVDRYTKDWGRAFGWWLIEKQGPRDDRWYLKIMAPNTKGEKFAWLDPTSIYINGEAFHDLLDDLEADLEGASSAMLLLAWMPWGLSSAPPLP